MAMKRPGDTAPSSGEVQRQRFGSHELPCASLHDGLVSHRECPGRAGQGGPERLFDGASLVVAVLDQRVEAHGLPVAAPLGLVHGEVGLVD